MRENIQKYIEEITYKDKGSFYIYDREVIDEKIDNLKECFKDIYFLYSLKTNPYSEVVKYILNKGIGADAASAAEVELAIKSGARSEDIYYSAPGKTVDDIEASIGKCTIIADSLEEIKLINTIACKKGEKVKIGVRVNPDFSMFSEEGLSSKFGIDVESLIENKDEIESYLYISIVGVHVHLNSQILDVKTLSRYYRKVFKCVSNLKNEFGWNIRFINFGGGLGIPYSSSKDKALDTKQLGNICSDIVKEFDDFDNTRLIIESGRYIVCESGLYVTPIVDIKESRGIKYIIVQNGLNGFLRPALAALLKNASKSDLLGFSAEPLFTGVDAFDYSILGKDDSSVEKVNIVGNLCTSTDILAEGVLLTKASIGDYVVVTKAGSYAYSLSPVLFASQPIPKQYLV